MLPPARKLVRLCFRPFSTPNFGVSYLRRNFCCFSMLASLFAMIPQQKTREDSVQNRKHDGIVNFKPLKFQSKSVLACSITVQYQKRGF